MTSGPRTLRSAAIALGRLERERDQLTRAEAAALYGRAAAALDAVDARLPVDDVDGRRRLVRAERRYRRVRGAAGDVGLVALEPLASP
ncbi:MAG: hypothetical protein OXH38_11735 [Chloroflexi bacterium]|nr:hypothetical protein [Chloroflexota bacterium]